MHFEFAVKIRVHLASEFEARRIEKDGNGRHYRNHQHVARDRCQRKPIHMQKCAIQVKRHWASRGGETEHETKRTSALSRYAQ